MAGPRNILVTGGTSGIGLALAENLSNRHRVLTTGRSLSDPLRSAIADRPDLDFVACDQKELTTFASPILKKLEEKNWSHLDHVVLNAGTGYVCDPALESAETIRTTLAVNLRANIELAQLLYPFLEAKHGKLTFVGSTARKGAPNFASYAASKAALHGMARALKEEWRGRVRVQMIHPGPTKTDMHAKAGLKLGRVRNLFADPKAMAMMIENAMAREKFTANLGLVHYWSGAQFLGRGLR